MAKTAPFTGTRDEDYNLISVLYHALQGCETCATYSDDARRAGDQDLAQYFSLVQEEYRRLADRGRELLGQRMGRGAVTTR